MIRQILSYRLWLHFLAIPGILGVVTLVGEEQGPFLLSSEGSGRATAYVESPKIITFEGKTHVTWLDSPEAGFRVRIRTLNHASGEWSPAWTIGEATDNHGGPALTIDKDGYLHVLYYSHHHPFRYRRSVRPNDASEWTPYEEFGINLTYPALACDQEGTLLMTARRSYDDRPWELEMWTRESGETWQRKGALLRSRNSNYVQWAASLAWGPDHKTLHLGTRIYEMGDAGGSVSVTTVGYMRSADGGISWEKSDGTPISLPAMADSIDVLASARSDEERVAAAGSIGINPDGVPFVPYSIRTQETCHAYLASPMEDGKWRHHYLNAYLPQAYREWDLFMHGGISFGASGQPLLVATIMQVPDGQHEWGYPNTELVRFISKDAGASFQADVLGNPDATSPRWMPNIERPTGFNQMPEMPGFIYTDGVRGEALGDVLSNKVIWVPGIWE